MSFSDPLFRSRLLIEKDELEKRMLLKSMLWVRDQMTSRDWKQESNLYLMNPNQE